MFKDPLSIRFFKDYSIGSSTLIFWFYANVYLYLALIGEIDDDSYFKMLPNFLLAVKGVSDDFDILSFIKIEFGNYF